METIRSRKKHRKSNATPWHNSKDNYTIMVVAATKHQYRTRTGKHCCCKHERGQCCAANKGKFVVPPRTSKV